MIFSLTHGLFSYIFIFNAFKRMGNNSLFIVDILFYLILVRGCVLYHTYYLKCVVTSLMINTLSFLLNIQCVLENNVCSLNSKFLYTFCLIEISLFLYIFIYSLFAWWFLFWEMGIKPLSLSQILAITPCCFVSCCSLYSEAL